MTMISYTASNTVISPGFPFFFHAILNFFQVHESGISAISLKVDRILPMSRHTRFASPLAA
jgi:hypothetical protein